VGPRNSPCTPTVSRVREQFLCSITLHDPVVSPVTATICIGQVRHNILLCDDQADASPLNGDQRLQELSIGGGAILRIGWSKSNGFGGDIKIQPTEYASRLSLLKGSTPR
jgi:hypothetical protein